MEQPNPMTLKKYHLALLRPSVLQILRAQGYYGCRPSVLDSVTELAGEYMAVLAREAHRNAEHNHPWDQSLTIPDVRQALEYVGALVPDDMVKKEDCGGDEESRGVETFKRWVEGPKNTEINRVAEAFQQTGQLLEPPDGERVDQIHRDYLSQLKQKHSKNDDSKYAGTVLGKGIDHGEVMVEGGPVTSPDEWANLMLSRCERPPEPDLDSRPPSSGLSSLDDGDVEMMEL